MKINWIKKNRNQELNLKTKELKLIKGQLKTSFFSAGGDCSFFGQKKRSHPAEKNDRRPIVFFVLIVFSFFGNVVFFCYDQNHENFRKNHPGSPGFFRWAFFFRSWRCHFNENILYESKWFSATWEGPGEEKARESAGS